MEGQIEEAEKTRRSSVLLNLTKGQAEKYRKAYIGSETDVLLEEPVKVGDTMYMTGFTMNYMKVLVPAADLIVKYAQIDPDKLAGQIVHVTLTGESEDGKALVSELA
jgi:tRNA A37 methylthiotransferase MiaB